MLIPIPGTNPFQHCNANSIACDSARNLIAVAYDTKVQIYRQGFDGQEIVSLNEIIGFNEDNEVSNVAFSSKGSYLFISCGKLVYQVKLVEECLLPGIVSIVKLSCSVYDYCSDDINCIAVDSTNPWLSVCDDDGNIVIIDYETHKLISLLSNKHESICSSTFYSRISDSNAHMSSVLISGGFDFKLNFFFTEKNKYKLRHTIDCRDANSDTVDTSEVSLKGDVLNSAKHSSNSSSSSLLQVSRMFNPPFVHSLSIFRDLLVVGLGDGRIAAFALKSKQLLASFFAHTSASTCVGFVVSSIHPSPIMYSCGNDKSLCLWNIDDLILRSSGSEMAPPTALSTTPTSVTIETSPLTVVDLDAQSKQRLLTKIHLSNSPNWVSHASINGQSVLFIAHIHGVERFQVEIR
jgi:hypothetical protein